MKKFAVLLSLALTVLSADGFAQSRSSQVKPVYAVLSLIGDQLDFVARQAEKAVHDPKPIDDPVFDQTAIRAAATVLQKKNPTTEVAALNTRSKALFEQRANLFAVSGKKIVLPDEVKQALKNEEATHLILITKHLDEFPKDLKLMFEGVDKLSGLGFYVDGLVTLKTDDSSQIGQGLIAPFAFFKITYIEVAKARVIHSQTIRSAVTFIATNSGESHANAWAAITAKQKVDAMNQLISTEIAKALPDLLTKK